MIDSWITRSKELPLHLELDLSCSDSHPVLQALIPHSHRWEHVDFCLEPDSIPVLACVKARLHSLKKLNLFFGDASGTIDFCEVAPRLTEVRLTGVHGGGPPVIIKLPWDQLRVCTLDTSEVAHYVLQHAKNLRRLYLDTSLVSELPRERMSIQPHSYHLGLNALTIEWTYAVPDINSFFSSITLPSLQTLQVRFDYYPRPSHILAPAQADENQAALASILARFFERSCARLSTLKLTNAPFSPGGLIKCLTFASLLVSLDVHFQHRWHAIDSGLLDVLNVAHPGRILPHLRSRTLRGPAKMFTEQALNNLVTSRRRIDPKHAEFTMLENLTLQRWHFDGLPRFHRFVSEGFNITYEK